MCFTLVFLPPVVVYEGIYIHAYIYTHICAPSFHQTSLIPLSVTNTLIKKGALKIIGVQYLFHIT